MAKIVIMYNKGIYVEQESIQYNLGRNLATLDLPHFANNLNLSSAAIYSTPYPLANMQASKTPF